MGHYDDQREYEYQKQRIYKKKCLEAALKDFREFRCHRVGKNWGVSHIYDGDRLFNEIERNIKAELYELRGLPCA